MTLQIADQGKGISPEKLISINAQSGGVGVAGMRERLRQFGGTLDILSADEGVSLLVTVPAPQMPSTAALDRTG